MPGEDNTKVGMLVVANPAAGEDDQNRWLIWVDGCAGTPETRGFLALEGVEAGQPDWQAANQDWIARAKQGPGTAGGPDPVVKTRTSYIFNNRTTPYGRSWGAPFAPTAVVHVGSLPVPVAIALAVAVAIAVRVADASSRHRATDRRADAAADRHPPTDANRLSRRSSHRHSNRHRWPRHWRRRGRRLSHRAAPATPLPIPHLVTR